jgi:hypothetical protein
MPEQVFAERERSLSCTSFPKQTGCSILLGCVDQGTIASFLCFPSPCRGLVVVSPTEKLWPV